MTSHGQGARGRVSAWCWPNTTSRRYKLPPELGRSGTGALWSDRRIRPPLCTGPRGGPVQRSGHPRCVALVRTHATSHPPAEAGPSRSGLGCGRAAGACSVTLLPRVPAEHRPARVFLYRVSVLPLDRGDLLWWAAGRGSAGVGAAAGDLAVDLPAAAAASWCVFAAWKSTLTSRWNLSVLRVQMLYSAAHAMAIWDTLRGHTAAWVPTGSATTGASLSTKISRLACGWLVTIELVLLAGVTRGVLRYGIERWIFVAPSGSPSSLRGLTTAAASRRTAQRDSTGAVIMNTVTKQTSRYSVCSLHGNLHGRREAVSAARSAAGKTGRRHYPRSGRARWQAGAAVLPPGRHGPPWTPHRLVPSR
jgi:hypothetical protein